MSAVERVGAEEASPAHAVAVARDALIDAEGALVRAWNARGAAFIAYTDALTAESTS